MFNSGFLSFGYSIFKWSRMYEALIIFQTQKWTASKKFGKRWSRSYVFRETTAPRYLYDNANSLTHTHTHMHARTHTKHYVCHKDLYT
jgi:hypothetical protein